MTSALGYSLLIERYDLRALPLDESARLEPNLNGRDRQLTGGQCVQRFGSSYQPEDTLVAHIQFALRYEGVNLLVLALLFEQVGGEAELCQWLKTNPESSYARRACFLYEWLTEKALPIDDPVSPRARYVKVLDAKRQFALDEGDRITRFRVINNLLGSRSFCPVVYKTDFLDTMVLKDLRSRTKKILASYDQDLLRRAATYLYLKETQSSFEVEREKPSPQRAQRFADLLRQADIREPLTEERLVKLQNAVLDPRFHEYTWRHEQNWIGKDLINRRQVDFVPPRSEDVPNLMGGLLKMTGKVSAQIDAVVAAVVIAFGFVYIHPFMDGNGRIHRYLIHDVLAKAGFTPRGIVLPVSAVILASLDDYVSALEHFSRPINKLTDFDPDMRDVPATGNDAVYFKYPNLTAQAEFLYRVLERTVEEDLQHEINFLLGFDKAYTALNNLLDWPNHSIDLFIRIVHQNKGELSGTKRKSHFAWMHDAEVAKAEECVREAFLLEKQKA